MDNKKEDDPDYILNIKDEPEKSDILLMKTFEWVICLVLSIAVALAIRYYIVTPRIVDQFSMFPTLNTGQHVVVNRLKGVEELKRGDIIIFQSPSVMYIKDNVDLLNPVARYDEQDFSKVESFKFHVLEINKNNYVKRIIGIPGDSVKILDEKVYLNGELLDEPYIPSDIPTTSMSGEFTDIVVPDGHFFVMGDNRVKSTDSRCFACIPFEKVDGEIFVITTAVFSFLIFMLIVIILMMLIIPFLIKKRKHSN